MTRFHALFLLLPLCLVSLLRPEAAHAEGERKLAADGARYLVRGETVPAQGLLFGIGLGWEASDLASLNGQLGYAWGTQKTSLLNPLSAHHVSIDLRLRTPFDEFDSRYSSSVMVGHSWRYLAYFGIEAGVTARFGDGTAVGPLARARLGFKNYGLYMYGGRVYGDQDDTVFGIGIEYFKLPEFGLMDHAKKLAKEAVL